MQQKLARLPPPPGAPPVRSVGLSEVCANRGNGTGKHTQVNHTFKHRFVHMHDSNSVDFVMVQMAKDAARNRVSIVDKIVNQ